MAARERDKSQMVVWAGRKPLLQGILFIGKWVNSEESDCSGHGKTESGRAGDIMAGG